MRIKKFLKESLPDTRSFEGCQGIQLYVSIESPSKLVLHEKWTSEEAFKKYIAWRAETRALDRLAPMLSETFNPEFYQIIDE